MTKLMGALIVLLSLAQAPAAAAAEPVHDPDVYLAPLDEPEGLSPAAAAEVGSHVSQASLRAFAWGRPGQGVDGAELYLDGALVGPSPLTLAGALARPQGVSLAARAEGYEDAERLGLRLPEEGRVSIALLPEDSAWPVTTPGWALGLGLVLAGVLTYRSDSPGTGLALAGGGLMTAGLTQLWARFVTLPKLRAAVGAYNARPEADPIP